MNPLKKKEILDLFSNLSDLYMNPIQEMAHHPENWTEPGSIQGALACALYFSAKNTEEIACLLRMGYPDGKGDNLSETIQEDARSSAKESIARTQQEPDFTTNSSGGMIN